MVDALNEWSVEWSHLYQDITTLPVLLGDTKTIAFTANMVTIVTIAFTANMVTLCNHSNLSRHPKYLTHLTRRRMSSTSPNTAPNTATHGTGEKRQL